MRWETEDAQYDWLQSRYVESMRRNLGDVNARQVLTDEQVEREVEEAMAEIAAMGPEDEEDEDDDDDDEFDSDIDRGGEG